MCFLRQIQQTFDSVQTIEIALKSIFSRWYPGKLYTSEWVSHWCFQLETQLHSAVSIFPNLTFTDMQNCKSQQDTKEVVFTKFASPASVWMLLPSTMNLQNWDQSLQSFLTDQVSEQNADDGAGVNRAECRPPLPSSIAPGAAVITAPNSRQRHRRRHKWFKFRDKITFQGCFGKQWAINRCCMRKPTNFHSHCYSQKRQAHILLMVIYICMQKRTQSF